MQKTFFGDSGECPYWQRVANNDYKAHEIFSRHYSVVNPARKSGEYLRRKARSFSAGWSIVLLSHDKKAMFVWIWQMYGYVACRPYCLAFRNEGSELALSSKLILAAESHLGKEGWVGEDTRAAITFVCPKSTKGDGYCFKKAGWTKLKQKTTKGLIALEKKITPLVPQRSDFVGITQPLHTPKVFGKGRRKLF